MGNSTLNFRVDGSVALKPEYTNQQSTPIISIKNVRVRPQNTSKANSSRKTNVTIKANPYQLQSNQAQLNSPSARLYKRISNDPLLGSIPYASRRSQTLSKTDQRLFIKCSILITLFALAVILIGA